MLVEMVTEKTDLRQFGCTFRHDISSVYVNRRKVNYKLEQGAKLERT